MEERSYENLQTSQESKVHMPGEAQRYLVQSCGAPEGQASFRGDIWGSVPVSKGPSSPPRSNARRVQAIEQIVTGNRHPGMQVSDMQKPYWACPVLSCFWPAQHCWEPVMTNTSPPGFCTQDGMYITLVTTEVHFQPKTHTATTADQPRVSQGYK